MKIEKKKSYSVKETIKPTLLKCFNNPSYIATLYVKDYDALINVVQYIEENAAEKYSSYYIETFMRSYTFSNDSKFRIFVFHELRDICKSNIVLVDDRISNSELRNDINPVIVPYEYENGIMLNPKPLFVHIIKNSDHI